MTITLSSILDSIYASTALASLSPSSAVIPLLHHDHADALAVMIRDTASLLVSSMPPGMLSPVRFTDKTIELEPTGYCADAAAAQAAISAAIVSLVQAQLKIIISARPEAISLLPSLMAELISGIVALMTPPPEAATISPHDF